MRHLIQIRCIGGLQDPWQNQAIHKYTTLCTPLGGLEVFEAPEGPTAAGEQDPGRVSKAEAVGLLRNLPDNALKIALDEHGKTLSSEELARVICDQVDLGRPIAFFIGGSWGLDRSVLSAADMTLSFGRVTLPHALARIVLAEQIYRSLMIGKGRRYHK